VIPTYAEWTVTLAAGQLASSRYPHTNSPTVAWGRSRIRDIGKCLLSSKDSKEAPVLGLTPLPKQSSIFRRTPSLSTFGPDAVFPNVGVGQKPTRRSAFTFFLLRTRLTLPIADLFAARPRRLFKKESQHFARGIGTVRVRVSAICAAAGPGMTASVDEPLLDHRCPGLVSRYRVSIGPASGRSDLRALHPVTCPSLRLYDLRGIGRMDDLICIAMEYDGPHAKGVI
jgi:hypothetical protein